MKLWSFSFCLAAVSFLAGCGSSQNYNTTPTNPPPSFDTHLLEGSWVQTQLIKQDRLSGRTITVNADSTGRVDEGDSIDSALSYRFSAFTVKDNKLRYSWDDKDRPLTVTGNKVKDDQGYTLLEVSDISKDKMTITNYEAGARVYEKASDSEIKRLQSLKEYWLTDENITRRDT